MENVYKFKFNSPADAWELLSPTKPYADGICVGVCALDAVKKPI